MSINREMDTENVVDIYNGILLSRKKEVQISWWSDLTSDNLTQLTSLASYLPFSWWLIVITFHACVLSLQLSLILWDTTDYSLSGSSVHRILQARIPEWVVIPSSRGSPQCRDQRHISYVPGICRRVLYHWCHLGNPVINLGVDFFFPINN